MSQREPIFSKAEDKSHLQKQLRSLNEAEAELESIRERMLFLEKERKEARLAEDSLQAEVWEAFKRSAEATRTFELALCGL